MTNLFNGTIAELIEDIKSIPVDTDLLKFASESNFEDMLTKMYNGCPQLNSQYNALPCAPIDIVTPSYQFANEGLFIDIASYLNGEPEYWIAENYSNDSKPAKDIYINAAFQHNVPASVIFQKLLQIVQIIDSLEGNGQRLNVFLVVYSKNIIRKVSKNHSFFKCKIKDQSEPVNLHQLIYLCASPILLRYCTLLLHHTKFNNSGQGVYGNSAEADETEMVNEDIIYIPSHFYDKKHNLTDYSKINLKEAYKIN